MRYTRPMPAPELPEPLAAHYHATWFDYVDGGGRRFSARPADARPEASPAWDLPERFVVVTAWNPDSTPAPRADNDAANVRLGDELRAAGATVRPIVGHSADRAWAEQSFAVWDVPDDAVARLAVAHGQHAIFVVTGGWRTLAGGNRAVDTDRGMWLHVTVVD